jgi:hypothetical protein
MLTKQAHLDTLLTCNYAMKWFEIMKCTFILYLVTITNLSISVYQGYHFRV